MRGEISSITFMPHDGWGLYSTRGNCYNLRTRQVGSYTTYPLSHFCTRAHKRTCVHTHTHPHTHVTRTHCAYTTTTLMSFTLTPPRTTPRGNRYTSITPLLMRSRKIVVGILWNVLLMLDRPNDILLNWNKPCCVGKFVNVCWYSLP